VRVKARPFGRYASQRLGSSLPARLLCCCFIYQYHCKLKAETAPLCEIEIEEEATTAMGSLHKQLRDFRLTTAEILYHMPDHPNLLQSYVWQELDLAPHFPALHKFLDFWSHNLDGKLHSVQVANLTLIKAPETRMANALLSLH
jgi:uncharacterized protein Usg